MMPEFIIRDDKMYVGKIVSRNEDGSITVDLYRNIEDYEIGAVMELDFTYWPNGIKCAQPTYPDYSLFCHLDLSVSGLLH